MSQVITIHREAVLGPQALWRVTDCFIELGFYYSRRGNQQDRGKIERKKNIITVYFVADIFVH